MSQVSSFRGSQLPDSEDPRGSFWQFSPVPTVFIYFPDPAENAQESSWYFNTCRFLLKGILIPGSPKTLQEFYSKFDMLQLNALVHWGSFWYISLLPPGFWSGARPCWVVPGTIDYRREDGRFLVSKSCVRILNPDSLSSSETGVNYRMRSCKMDLSQWAWYQEDIGGNCSTKPCRAETPQSPLVFDNLKPWHKNVIFKSMSWVQWFAFWRWLSRFSGSGSQLYSKSTQEMIFHILSPEIFVYLFNNPTIYDWFRGAVDHKVAINSVNWRIDFSCPSRVGFWSDNFWVKNYWPFGSGPLSAMTSSQVAPVSGRGTFMMVNDFLYLSSE